MSKIRITLTNGASYSLDADNDAYDSEDGDVRLMGFQDEAYVQRVNLFAEDWRKGDLQAAVGKFPVFSRGGEKGIFAFTIPVESIVLDSDWNVWSVGRPNASKEQLKLAADAGVTNVFVDTENAKTNEDLRVTFYLGDADGKPVVQVDGSGDFRINVNDAPVWDQHTERGRLVWVATITNEERIYDAPAVYVSQTESDLLHVVTMQNGAPAALSKVDLLEWFTERGDNLSINSHYIEG